MRAWIATAAVAMVVLLPTAWAQKAGKPGRGRGGQLRGDRELRQALKEAHDLFRPDQFNPDINGDGVVDNEEAKEAAEHLAQSLSTVIDRIRESYDTDGDGRLNDVEMERMKSSLEDKGLRYPKFVERLDTNHDWAVSEDERAAFVTAMTRRFLHNGGQGTGSKPAGAAAKPATEPAR